MYKINEIVTATVTGIENYGIFVSLENDYRGLIHISEVDMGFVSDLKKYVEVGEIIFARVIQIDESDKHVTLSIKNINYRNDSPLGESIRGFSPLYDNLPIWINESKK